MMIIGADGDSVKHRRTPVAGKPGESRSGGCKPHLVRSATTLSESIAKVGELSLPGDGFADDIEAIQGAPGVAEMPNWPE
jgi:hypothetical protein